MQSALIVFVLVVGLVFLPIDFLGGLFTADRTMQRIIGMSISRAVFFGIMAYLLLNLSLGKLLRPGRAGIQPLLLALPCFLIALNNFPVIEFFSGDVSVTAGSGAVLLFALECLCVAAFEETAFRGVIFPLLLQGTGTSVKGRFLAVLSSGALFGILHLCNLFGNWGAIAAVAMQIGYSFLLGCMLAVLVFAGASVWTCVAVHGLYNFCGLLIGTLGAGAQWHLPRIVLTVALSLAVGVYCLLLLLKAKPGPADALLRQEAPPNPRE